MAQGVQKLWQKECYRRGSNGMATGVPMARVWKGGVNEQQQGGKGAAKEWQQGGMAAEKGAAQK